MLSEFDLIAEYFNRPRPVRATLGIGDDCALLTPRAGMQTAISSDMLVEGRHFFAGADPASVGHKALAVNLSDLAAMGAEPLGFTLAIALPAVDDAWLAAFCRGLFDLADDAACPLVGGDTTRGPLAMSVTVFGQVPPGQALRRDGARAGNEVWVSGPLGGAARAVAARSRSEPVDAGAARRLDWPQPRLALGLALRGVAHAAIDLSDGLAGDLRHILAASSAAAGSELKAELVADSIPLDPSLAGLPRDAALDHAVSGGDDYELLFTALPADRDRIAQLWPAARMIGRLRAGSGILVSGRDGAIAPLDRSGFDHFER
jgi:thiamine-monophosphate kinase